MIQRRFDELISEIGDPYFTIAPEDCQNKNFPSSIDIWDCEGETTITINCGSDSRKEAEALLEVLNFDQ